MTLRQGLMVAVEQIRCVERVLPERRSQPTVGRAERRHEN